MAEPAFYNNSHFRQSVAETLNWLTRWRLPIRLLFLTPLKTEKEVATRLALQGLGQKIQLLNTSWANHFSQFVELIFCIMVTAKQYRVCRVAWLDCYAMIHEQKSPKELVQEQTTKRYPIDRATWQQWYDPINDKLLTFCRALFHTCLLGFCCLSIVEAFSSSDENRRFFRSQLPANIHYILTEASQSQEEIEQVLALVGMEDKADMVKAAIAVAMKADVWTKKATEAVGGYVSQIAGIFWMNLRGIGLIPRLPQ